MANHQREHLGEEFKDEKTKKPSALEKRKLKEKEKEIMNNYETSSSRSSSSNSNPTTRVSRVAHRLRNPTVRFGKARRSFGERKAEALALGVSFAAFASLVIEKKSGAGQNTNVDDHPLIYASAVKESLANIYGRKLGSFAERSFNSTLRILKVMNDSASPHQLDTEIGDVSEAALGANTGLEDDLVTPIMNCLVSSVINALAWILYISNVFSQPEEEGCSGGLASQVSTEFINMLMCRHRFWVQMYFGFLMIFVLTYLIINRSSGTKMRKRTTYSLLSFGIVSCLLGKFCVDTLGQSIGKLWLFLWAMLCLWHYVADVFILALVGLLYGPFNVTRRTESSTIVPYWACASFLLVASLLVLPLINGFLSVATFGEWRDHFSFITYAYESWWFGL